MNEAYISTPDSLIKSRGKTLSEGQDHNWEYHIFGEFGRNLVYVPNANVFVKEFIPRKFILVNKNPGYLFSPAEKYNEKKLPKR